ncbi:Transcriptional adapter ada2 [Thoreauomyces humboldtii]|nr:Transcriptional adapter ada2 [Thoreauomyces humboldtii]
MAVSPLSGIQKRRLGFVKLDVYATFLTRPQALLFDRTARKRDVMAWRERNPTAWFPTTTGTTVVVKKSTASTNQTSSPSLDHRIVVVRRKRGRPGRKPVAPVPSRSGFSSSSSSETTGSFVPMPENVTTGAPVVTWTKGEPLPVARTAPGYDLLTREEVRTCCTLRLSPEAYLKIKAILLGARDERGSYKKRDAQKWCRIDVNKTGKLYDWFVAVGWLQGYN